jgi:hypothetical protein
MAVAIERAGRQNFAKSGLIMARTSVAAVYDRRQNPWLFFYRRSQTAATISKAKVLRLGLDLGQVAN